MPDPAIPVKGEDPSAPSPRKPISKKLRFEVFKRDSFACQYCGAKAPDVVLQVDHIDPVCKGGNNDILNLTTSCEDCNGGKSGRRLSDGSALQAKRKQLEALQERREQIEMMVSWQEGLRDMKTEEEDQVARFWSDTMDGAKLTRYGMKQFRKHLKKFGLAAVLEAVMIAADQYLRHDNRGRVIADSVEHAFAKVGGICFNRKQESTDPIDAELDKMRAFLRKKRLCDSEREMQVLVLDAISSIKNMDSVEEFINDLWEITKETESWINWAHDLTALSHGWYRRGHGWERQADG